MDKEESQIESLGWIQIARLWWPLVASNLLISLEQVMLLAFLARMNNSAVLLAAFGGVVFVLAITIQAPAAFLIPTANALCTDKETYHKLCRFALILGILLTSVHALIAFTPLFDLVVIRWIGVPDELLEPARLGLRILSPWTLFTSYRNVQQGVLIRYGRTRLIAIGTMLRVGVEGCVLLGLLWTGNLSGMVIITCAVIVGTIIETVYIQLAIFPIGKNEIPMGEPSTTLSSSALLRFYLPLALTEIISIPVHPLRSAALSRMPLPIESLAVFSIVHNILALLLSIGRAYQEVVVALMNKPDGLRKLRCFAIIVAIVLVGIVFLLAMPIVANPIFERISGLSVSLLPMARTGMWIALLYPGLLVFYNFFVGLLVGSRRTWALPIGLIIFLITSTSVYGFGVLWGQTTGFYIGLIALQAGFLAETIWVWWISRSVLSSSPSHPI